MASNILSILADVPELAPSEAVAVELETVARKLFEQRCAEISVVDSGMVEFIDQGGLFGELNCPNCGSEIDIPWWQDRMDESYANSFSDLGIRVPCCGFATSLNELEYRLPAGFARFAIQVRDFENPWADEEEMAALTRVAGRPLRQILARY